MYLKQNGNQNKTQDDPDHHDGIKHNFIASKTLMFGPETKIFLIFLLAFHLAAKIGKIFPIFVLVNASGKIGKDATDQT